MSDSERFTRPATWQDVKRIAELFAREGVEWALIGGYAIAAHRFVRFSEDVDVLVEPSSANARRWTVPPVSSRVRRTCSNERDPTQFASTTSSRST